MFDEWEKLGLKGEIEGKISAIRDEYRDRGCRIKVQYSLPKRMPTYLKQTDGSAIAEGIAACFLFNLFKLLIIGGSYAVYDSFIR